MDFVKIFSVLGGVETTGAVRASENLNLNKVFLNQV
jgi:hypothetical protein